MALRAAGIPASASFTGVVLFADGASNAPSMGFILEPTSGFFRAGAGAIDFSLLGVPMARFASGKFIATSFVLDYSNQDVTLSRQSGRLCLNSATATPAGGATTLALVFGSTSGFGIYVGSGIPTVSAAQGSIYLRSEGSSSSTRMYVNTNGTTGWTNVTTAA